MRLRGFDRIHAGQDIFEGGSGIVTVFRVIFLLSASGACLRGFAGIFPATAILCRGLVRYGENDLVALLAQIVKRLELRLGFDFPAAVVLVPIGTDGIKESQAVIVTA